MPDEFLAPKLPADEEAERVVIGGILTGHDQAAEVMDLLNVDDFDDARNQTIWIALKEMWDAGSPLDLPALIDFLVPREELDKAGGMAYLSILGEGIHNKMRMDRYASNIRKARVRREFVKDSNRWILSMMEGERPDFILEEAQDRIAKLAMMFTDDDAGTTFHAAAMEMAAKLLQGDVPHSLYTGLQGVDSRTGGFQAGELSIITAETGVGKTHFALQISRKSCEIGRHLLYCSGEMLAGHLMKRVMASNSPVPYAKLRTPSLLTMFDKDELMAAAMTQCRKCRILDKELSLRRIRAGARLLKGHLGGLVVDYDELVEVRGKDEWDQQRILVRSLKSLAMELSIPVIVVSQLSKTVKRIQGQPPTLQSLYGSGSKAKHASCVLFVDRPFVQDLESDEADAEIYVLKSRDGRMGKTKCKFNVRTFTFEEVAS